MVDLARTCGLLSYYKNKDTPDLLGERTKFRYLVCKMVKAVVTQGKWFGFVTLVDKSQVDIMTVENNDGNRLGRMIYEELDTEEGYRVSLYRYLLHDYLCYLEVPTVVKQRDSKGVKDSYSKSLITSNVGVIANWLGISYAEAKMMYYSRLDDNGFERMDEYYPYVKLTVGKDGTHKISKPRKDLDLSIKGTRIIPLFAIECGLKILFKMCLMDFHNITFIKDSGQKRTVNICFDWNKLKEVYSDYGLLLSSYEEQYHGDFLESESLTRGYIRAIEVGTSLKSRPVRAINLARILSIEKAEPDLTFIDIDLDTVKDSFLSYLASKKVNYKELVDMLDVFNVGSDRKYNGKTIGSYMELENWVESQEILLSTPFLKQLALFMIGNPQWFDGYTGKEVPSVISEYSVDDGSDDDGEDDLDFDW